MDLKGKFPFRLGAPSYVIPGDILANVKYLSGKVDDIEIVLFESDEIAALPDCKSVMELRSIARHDDLTFTIHLPLDIRLGCPEKRERQKSIGICLRIIERMLPLSPFGFVLHCEREAKKPSATADIAGWRKIIDESIDELMASGLSSKMLCVETLDFPFEFIEPVIKERKLGICLDIGHILSNRLPAEDYIHRYFNETRIIHLHGVRKGKDHCDISAIDRKFLSLLFQRFDGTEAFEKVVCLEVFNPIALDLSLSIMEEFIS
jgi:sugar phosphate isomerase/epimerase